MVLKKNKWQNTLALAVVALSITACGGGSDDATPVSQPPTNPTVPANPTPPVDPVPPTPSGQQLAACSGANCSAVSNTQYTGSGVGVWKVSNTSASAITKEVSINGFTGQELTLIYTNEGAVDQPMPTISLSSANQPTYAMSKELSQSTHSAINEKVNQYNLTQWKEKAARSSNQYNTVLLSNMASSAPSFAKVGEIKSWNYMRNDNDNAVANATLVKQVSTKDGRLVNFWVQTDEYAATKITQTMIDQMAATFATNNKAIYDGVVEIAGAPWGPHNYSNMISGSNQPIDIVLVNITPDSRAYGTLGYFWSGNNFTKTSERNSNESLSFYLDTETLYLEKNIGVKILSYTLAHEFTHMANFYNRAVAKGSPDYVFSQFMEEMSALMMEDTLSSYISTDYHSIRDNQFPQWLNDAAYNCSINEFDVSLTGDCPGYAVHASFGSYLLRTYGVNFYKSVFRDFSSKDSMALLDRQIKLSGGSGMPATLSNWGTSIAVLPSDKTPYGFGLPSRTDVFQYPLVALDQPYYKDVRKLPTSVPATLQGNGGHFPFLRKGVSGTYTEKFTIPANTTLTIVVK